MNCERIEELISARFDDDLPVEDRAAFDAHVAGCAMCAANWADYRAAVGVLRGSGAAATSPELHAATLAAVAQAGLTTGSRRRPWPLLLASIAGAAAALFFVWLVVGFGRGTDTGRDAERSIDVVVASDLVALRPGETRAVGGVVVSRSAAGLLSVRAEPVTPTIVEKIVEKIVEVPVERVVEKVVQVPVDRVVEVRVERGPLFAIDVTALAAALRDAGKVVGSGMLALAAAQGSSSSTQTTPTGAGAASLPTARLAAAPPAAPLPAPRGASLQVWRRDGRMTFEASGTLEELVPTLLCQLSTADTELQALIERQLAVIHEQAAADPAIRSALVAMPAPRVESTTDERSIFGGRRAPAAAEPPAVAWAAWWDANGGLITQSAGL